MNSGQAYNLLSKQKPNIQSKRKKQVWFGTEQTTDAKFEYSKEEKVETYTCRSCLQK